MDPILLRVLMGAGLFFLVMGAFLFLAALSPGSRDEQARERDELSRSLNGQSSPDYGYGRHKRVR